MVTKALVSTWRLICETRSKIFQSIGGNAYKPMKNRALRCETAYIVEKRRWRME